MVIRIFTTTFKSAHFTIQSSTAQTLILTLSFIKIYVWCLSFGSFFTNSIVSGRTIPTIFAQYPASDYLIDHDISKFTKCWKKGAQFRIKIMMPSFHIAVLSNGICLFFGTANTRLKNDSFKLFMLS